VAPPRIVERPRALRLDDVHATTPVPEAGSRRGTIEGPRGA